jgi:hypothetical protein
MLRELAEARLELARRDTVDALARHLRARCCIDLTASASPLKEPISLVFEDQRGPGR